MGTAIVRYNPVLDKEEVVYVGRYDYGRTSIINTKFHCITLMKEYENKSFEELRLEDRMAGRCKWSSIPGSWGKPQAKPLSGGLDQPAETKPLSGGFDQPAETEPLSGGFVQPAETEPLSGGFEQPAETEPLSGGFDQAPETKPSNIKLGLTLLQNVIGTAGFLYNPLHLVSAMSNAKSTNTKSHWIVIKEVPETKPLSGGFDQPAETEPLSRGFDQPAETKPLSGGFGQAPETKPLSGGFDQPAEAKPPNGKSEGGPSKGLFGNASGEGTSTEAFGGTGSDIPSWDVPECPVCLEAMSAPIVQCQGGHSICGACSKTLAPPKCPICRKPMTTMRNWTLEDIVEKAVARGALARTVKRACAHAAAGCAREFATARDATDHAHECDFRDVLCPLSEADDNCFWIGKPKDMMAHFKQKHPSNCVVPGSVVQVRDVREGRNAWLLAQDGFHFIVSLKMDPDGVDWLVHHIGSKKNANLYIYEIHVISKQEASRRVVFSERCVSAAEAAAAPFGAGRCAALPARLLPHFAKDGELGFRVSVRKDPADQPPDITNLALV